ncbi:Holliday junction branch migration protein RuvA [Ligilactobacillus apodemi]|uniref:Holliday junction branch migration complex subunit RuvA n=1 Tax=Ligilactobacillus apodemi DSM 16634 = JCM 16172 TaxID=1423724 RepID=A0A0R1U074_9LACO|nr:Holliday junction branch migration protein RuvA [Ligilactobacillus apodemi]KRL84274.1 Holliday junction DNA helicase RuvA [Ligilactobacillus apodemi DSM 16634 = JCM 16172]MBD5069971.1 Holliday junction branch migration protein RuvA [Lactobacillus sp.]MCR1901319.1 Holliday junction branch migration protein RuvA [Ligilactobacillus apodemi]
MYEYIIGNVVTVTPRYIVVESGGIGYLIYVANPFKYTVDTLKQQKIYVYQAVRETEIMLYGFYDEAEKQLFLKMLSVSGIGPKSALAVLASEDHQGFINAIEQEDDGYLTNFPGIGKKTAKQIILDLKGKLSDLTKVEMLGQQGMDLTQKTSPYLLEAIEALTALGYTKTEIKRVSKKLEKYDGNSTDDYLRQGLRLIMKK